MKSALIWIIIGVVLYWLASTCDNHPSYVRKAAHVEMGMTKDQVISIMGSDYKIENKPGADGEGSIPALSDKQTDLIWDGFQNTAGVRFDSLDRVINIFEIRHVPDNVK